MNVISTKKYCIKQKCQSSTKKYCIVPKCLSTTKRTPEKLFFTVPRNPKLRELWCKVVKRNEKIRGKLSPKSTHYCCEDHFNVEEDMENYIQYKLTGKNIRKILKPGVLPHRFDCQKEQPHLTESEAAAKRRHLQLTEEAISQARLISLSLSLEAESRTTNKAVMANEDIDSNPRVNFNEEIDSCVEDCKPSVNETSKPLQENPSSDEKHFEPINVGTFLMYQSLATSPIEIPVNNSINLTPDLTEYISKDEISISSPSESSVSSTGESSGFLEGDEQLTRNKYAMMQGFT